MIKAKYLFSVISTCYEAIKKKIIKNYNMLTNFGWNSKPIRDKE